QPPRERARASARPPGLRATAGLRLDPPRGYGRRPSQRFPPSQEAQPMEPSIPRPTGPDGSPVEPPPRRDMTDYAPILGAPGEGPGKFRSGTSGVALCNPTRIGLLVLVVIVLPWLPILGPPGDATRARRARGVGDLAILTVAFAPRGETIATIQTDG